MDFVLFDIKKLWLQGLISDLDHNSVDCCFNIILSQYAVITEWTFGLNNFGSFVSHNKYIWNKYNNNSEHKFNYYLFLYVSNKHITKDIQSCRYRSNVQRKNYTILC